MSEIKTSAKGVDYADPCTLQIKKRVYYRNIKLLIYLQRQNLHKKKNFLM